MVEAYDRMSYFRSVARPTLSSEGYSDGSTANETEPDEPASGYPHDNRASIISYAGVSRMGVLKATVVCAPNWR